MSSSPGVLFLFFVYAHPISMYFRKEDQVFIVAVGLLMLPPPHNIEVWLPLFKDYIRATAHQRITQLDDEQTAAGLSVVCSCMTCSRYFCHLL